MKAAVLAAATLAATAIIACSGGMPKTHPTLAPPPTPINQEAADRRVEALQRAILEQIAQRPNPAVPEETVPAGPTEEAALTGLPTATNPPPPPARSADPTKQDVGISTPEATPPENTSQAAFEILFQHSWTSDGLSDAEKETTGPIGNLIRTYPDIGMRLVQMPFLETHEPTDTGAAAALWHIARTNPGQTRRILDHPSLSSGITDAQTPLVALTYSEYLFGDDPDRILSDRELQSHTHPAELPMTSNILITIVSRTGTERAETTATRVQSELAWLERYLDQKLSTHNVVIHYSATMPPAAKGANVQTSVMQPAHHQTPGQHRWVQHELAHYWFNNNETWLDEGMVQTLTSLIAAGSHQPPTLPETAPRCANTVRLRERDTGRGSQHSTGLAMRLCRG